MANSIYNMLGNSQPSGPLGNVMQMMKQFNEFKSSFTGNPQQQLQQMLNSGKISQAQLNQCVQLAKQFQQFIK